MRNFAKCFSKVFRHLSANQILATSHPYTLLNDPLLDSLNINLPVLSSDCSGAKDILANHTKSIFKVNDKEDLIKKLKFFISNKKNMNYHVRKSHKNLKKFLISNCSKYKSLIDNL